MEAETIAELKVTLAGQWKLLEARRERGIPITAADLKRTVELERRILTLQRKAA